jgi:hypothetical protein
MRTTHRLFLAGTVVLVFSKTPARASSPRLSTRSRSCSCPRCSRGQGVPTIYRTWTCDLLPSLSAVVDSIRGRLWRQSRHGTSEPARFLDRITWRLFFWQRRFERFKLLLVFSPSPWRERPLSPRASAPSGRPTPSCSRRAASGSQPHCPCSRQRDDGSPPSDCRSRCAA